MLAALGLVFDSAMRQILGEGLGSELRRLTFELTGRQRQDAKPGLAKMYRVPPDRAWWPAVAAPVERGVRPRCAGVDTERAANIETTEHGLGSRFAFILAGQA